jgi:organic hydroperoxide reductase OsmC/OhrA
MHRHDAEIVWHRHGEAFTDNRYNRAHLWCFDGGAEVAASPSPLVVPPPWSDARAVDPEEAFVASLASCHMLWFLSIAAGRGLVVDRYLDRAQGTMDRNTEGRLAITVVTLRPQVDFSGPQPSRDEIEALHRAAHAECFIANSVRSEIRCEPVFIDTP